MPYYLDSYVGKGTRPPDDFRPTAFDDDPAAAAIDLRPDGSVVDGRALVFTPTPLPNRPSLRQQLSDTKHDRSAALTNAIQNRLGINLSDPNLDFTQIVAELLTAHGRDDGTRWRNLTPSLAFPGTPVGARQYEIWLGDLLTSWPVIAGGATVTDDFNTANSTVVGHNQTWTETAGSWENLSNQMHLITTNDADNDFCRCEGDVGTTDMYAQATFATYGDENYICTRYDASVQTMYYGVSYPDGTMTIRKRVNNGDGRIGLNDSHVVGNGVVLRCEANGSSISVLYNGTLDQTLTDTAITTGTRGGAGGYRSGRDLLIDDFRAGGLLDGVHTYPGGVRLQPGLSVAVASRARR